MLQAPSSSAVPQYSEVELGYLLVASLKTQCTALDRVLSTPSNWALTADNDGTVPFELEADDGYDSSVYVRLLVTPADPVATLIISNRDSEIAGTSNWALGINGCSPLSSYSYDAGQSSNKGGASNESVVQVVQVPNFVGLQHSDAIFLSMKYLFTTQYSYNSGNPDSACTALHTGRVISQSVRPGSVAPNARTTAISLVVDCARR